MEILAIIYGTLITVGFGMFIYHNTGSRSSH